MPIAMNAIQMMVMRVTHPLCSDRHGEFPGWTGEVSFG
jgi:hypothetical protein